MAWADVTRRAGAPAVVRTLGLVVTAAYALFIGWIYAAQPRTIAEVKGGVAAGIGAYQIDRAAFDEGLAYFRTDRFPEARRAFERADPAQRDATSQFYIAYSYLRQGWGRVYHDDALYREGSAALKRAIAVAPGGVVRVDDADLRLKSSDEVAEAFARGLTREVSDLNPLRVLETRP